MKIKMICFDMDGTIADLYKVEDWLKKLREEDSTPYTDAYPMWNMKELADVLKKLQAHNIEIRVVTWLSKDSTQEYKKAVRKAKREWLDSYGFPYDNFHGIQYGRTKADAIRNYLNEEEEAILIDDNEDVRNGWTKGRTIDPTSCNIIEILENLIK
jgi:phosphoglycolate phosphatase-like HAD superfamily hydrolase